MKPHNNTPSRISSPKRKKNQEASGDSIAYNYYAAFSYSFVEDLIKEIRPSKGSLILDPWNGRGTTTAIAAHKGYKALGLDLNPAMVAVANAHLVNKDLAAKAQRRVARLRPPKPRDTRARNGDGLLTWLTPAAAGVFRSFQAEFERISADVATGLADHRHRYVQQKRLRQFLNVALCSALRNVLYSFETSNPTWITQPLSTPMRLRPSADAIDAFTKASLLAAVEGLNGDSLHDLSRANVAEADSRALPLPSESVDSVITSPPYCTRIDYAVATSPELFLLCGFTESSFRGLRDRLIGTTSITLRRTYKPPPEWGTQCVSLLQKVAAHPSHASDTYYLKTFLQYFSGLADSLRELNRVTTKGATLALVVQDSYYKEVHVNLPDIVISMCRHLGWRLADRHNYDIAATIAGKNPNARMYRDDFTATESLLVFKRANRAS